MKNLKIAVSFIMFISVIGYGLAQEISKNAIGLRIGEGDGFGTEVSYQRALANNNRLELGLGLRSGDDYDGYRLTGIYQWVWSIEDNFNWYAGAGGGVANYDYDVNVPGFGDGGETFVYAAGQIGIEYNFDIPLILSFDIRPTLGFGNFNDDFDYDFALGIRYQF